MQTFIVVYLDFVETTYHMLLMLIRALTTEWNTPLLLNAKIT